MDTLCHIQKDFFISNSLLNYCTLEMVAKECGLHASTISRAINQKVLNSTINIIQSNIYSVTQDLKKS